MRKISLRFWAKVLALLGVGGAMESCEIIQFGACMYGCPHADYKLTGSVTDEDGNPIPGISIRQYQSAGPNEDRSVIYDGWEGPELVKTEADGTFVIETVLTSFGGDEEFIFRDVDGPENGGEFVDEPMKIKFDQVKKGDKAWYGGAFEASDVKVVLKAKPEE